MAKNFKQLKGKFGRVLGFPYDPKQDPGRTEPPAPDPSGYACATRANGCGGNAACADRTAAFRTFGRAYIS